MSKTLDRIGLLLNQAENASTPEEAEAYMEKAQHLATLAAVDLEVARQRQADKTKREVPEQRNVTVAHRTVSEYGYQGKVQNNAAEMVFLFSAIAGQNDVKINIAHNSTYVIAFGFPSDIDVCEALFASLKVQMVTAADAALKRGDHKEELVTKYCYKTHQYVKKAVNGKTFRTSFYQGFTSAIGTRLRKARQEALAQAQETTFNLDVEVDGVVETTESNGALVFVGKAVEVSDFYKRTSTARGSYRGGQGRSGSSSSGHNQGHSAGNSARLGTERGITSGRSSIAS